MLWIVGTPFRLHYWLAQTCVYLAVMFLEKLIIGPLVAFSFWKRVGLLILALIMSLLSNVLTGRESYSTLEQ